MRMPFGKYKGFDLEELDEGYLLWVYQNCDKISPKLRHAIGEELDERGYGEDKEPEEPKQRRKTEPEPDPEPIRKPPSGPGLHLLIAPHQLELFGEMVELGYRALARRCHPDVGGSIGDMQSLNEMVRGLRRGVASATGGQRKTGAA